MKLSCNTWMYSSFPAWVPAYQIDYVIESLAAIGYERSLSAWRSFPYYIWIANYEEMIYHLELMKQIGDIRIYRVKPEGVSKSIGVEPTG